MVTEEIRCGMTEMAAGADNISEAVVKVSEISAANREHINALAGEVSKFRVD
jgi:hypothetical protein